MTDPRVQRFIDLQMAAESNAQEMLSLLDGMGKEVVDGHILGDYADLQSRPEWQSLVVGMITAAETFGTASTVIGGFPEGEQDWSPLDEHYDITITVSRKDAQ